MRFVIVSNWITVGGKGFEAESNEKYKDEGTSSILFWKEDKLPPSNFLVVSTRTGI